MHLQLIAVVFFSAVVPTGCGSQSREASFAGLSHLGTAPILFDTPAWQEPGVLLIRGRATDEEVLLLRHSSKGIVYQLDTRRWEISEADSSAWNEAAGATTECEMQTVNAPRTMRIDANGQLLLGEHRVETDGAIALAYAVRPDGGALAVLSADGRKGGLPFLGQGGGRGQHYHQTFSLPGLEFATQTARLPLGGPDETLTPCWSPTGQYVFYPDILFFRLAAVVASETTD